MSFGWRQETPYAMASRSLITRTWAIPSALGQLALVNDPGQVHRRTPPILDGPRTAKTGGGDRGRMLPEELLHNLVQSLIAAAGIRLQRSHLELPRVVLVNERQACVRAANIARKDHAGVFHSQDENGLGLKVDIESRGAHAGLDRSVAHCNPKAPARGAPTRLRFGLLSPSSNVLRRHSDQGPMPLPLTAQTAARGYNPV